MIRRCKTCGKEAPEMFSPAWNKEKWHANMSGVNVIAVWCPKHEKECHQFWEDHCAGRGIIEYRSGE